MKGNDNDDDKKSMKYDMLIKIFIKLYKNLTNILNFINEEKKNLIVKWIQNHKIYQYY